MCGGFWGKYHFESDDIVWFEMWDLGQNACIELIKLPDGSTHEKMSPANHIQAALKTYTGRYLLSLSDTHVINLTSHLAPTSSLTLGKVNNIMEENK